MRALPTLAAFSLAFVAASLMGCGETCQSTCSHVYDEAQCGIVRAGVTPARLVDDCVSQCERALRSPGDMGEYDPNVHVPVSSPVTLETDQQAAAWMDCVWRVAPDEGYQESCAQLDPRSGGICAPI